MGSLHEGLAAALVGEKWGYIDRYGAFKIKPQFEMAKEFAEGLAPVKSGGKWGYIDRTGTFRVPARFWLADRFSEGLACTRVDDGPSGYAFIDKQGDVVWKGRFF